MPTDAPVTANRRTRLAVDITEITTGRREWYLTRKAAEIQRDRANRPASAPKSENVWCVGGGDAWILKPIGSELAELNRTDTEPPITAAQANVASGYESMMMFRRSDDLPGVSPAGTTVAAGFNAFVKTVGALYLWSDAHLAADAAALPQVTAEVEDGDDNYPIDRVLSGTVSYPERAPFALRWYLPDDFSGTDAFLVFYFGGPGDVTPDDEYGGQFALSLRGGGTARLYEYDPNQAAADKWRRRMEWKYGDPGGFKGRYETLYVIPYGRNRIEFRSAGVNFSAYGEGFTLTVPLLQMMMGALTAQQGSPHLWKDLPALTGHSHKRAVTGAGNVRMDCGREKRVPFSIARMKYPAVDPSDVNGVVVDAPFSIPWELDAGTPITLHVDAFLPDNTSVAGSIFDVDTNVALTVDGNGNWLSNAGQSTYYVKIALASVDGTQTPVVWDYRISVDSAYRTNTRTANTAANVTKVSVNYACTDPTEETADLMVSDVLNACPILRQRDGIRSMLQVLTENGSSLVSNLFEGVTTSPQSIKRGTPGQTFPSENWNDVELRMTGIWERLAETFVLAPINFSQDDNADLDPDTQQLPPWKVTDAIRKLFNLAGFNDDDLDIPDLPYRIWPNPTDGSSDNSIVMQTGVDFASAIRRLSWDYLRMVVVRDVNCRSGQYQGKWRLISNPIPPYTNILAAFYLENPGTLSGKLPHMLGSYTVGTAPIWRESFRQWPVKPECNEVLVIGVNDKTGEQYWQIATNGPSIDDDSSPDYIGRHLPCYFPPDPSLTSQHAVDWACRIIYDAAAHAQKWCSFEAPLLLVTDTTDTLQVRPRPLRVNDLITVAGLSAVVREVSIDYSRDVTQQMNVTALFLTDTTWAAAAASSQQTIRKAVAAVVGQSRGEKPSMMAPVFQQQIMNAQMMPHHLTLPTTGSRVSLQNADGTFKHMLDYDPIN